MKIGVWHEAIVGKPSTDETTFADYASKYIKFIKDNNIERAFFILMDPEIAAGTYAKNGWLEKYWLNELPPSCEAGLVLDTEPCSHWKTSNRTFESGDTMELAFTYLSNLNNTAKNKVTCVGFDYENINSYYSQQGIDWIESLWKKYCPTIPMDYGFAPPSVTTNHQGVSTYPEIYWVGEMVACGCKGDEGTECKCPNTPYCKNNGDPDTLLNGKIGDYIANHKTLLSKPNVWPMFSIESLLNPKCVASDYNLKSDACGVLDAFGTWSKSDFLKFLDTVESKYGIKQAMIYEWQYVPKTWL